MPQLETVHSGEPKLTASDSQLTAYAGSAKPTAVSLIKGRVRVSRFDVDAVSSLRMHSPLRMRRSLAPKAVTLHPRQPPEENNWWRSVETIHTSADHIEMPARLACLRLCSAHALTRACPRAQGGGCDARAAGDGARVRARAPPPGRQARVHREIGCSGALWIDWPTRAIKLPRRVRSLRMGCKRALRNSSFSKETMRLTAVLVACAFSTTALGPFVHALTGHREGLEGTIALLRGPCGAAVQLSRPARD
eukprot:4533154-Pleurochrysis_carterae.AAC.1